MTPDIDYQAVLPLLMVFGTAIVSVLVEAFVPARARYNTQMALYVGGLTVSLIAVLLLAGTQVVTAEGAVAVDGPALFLQGTTILVAIGAGLLICERGRAVPGAASGRVEAGAVSASSSSSGTHAGTSRGPSSPASHPRPRWRRAATTSAPPNAPASPRPRCSRWCCSPPAASCYFPPRTT